MKLFTLPHLSKREKKEALVLPFWEKGKAAKPAASLKEFAETFKLPLESKDFVGKEGDILPLYQEGDKEKRYLLLGLGKEEKSDAESLRRVFGRLVRFCHKKGIKTVNILLPNVVELRELSVEECVKAVAEGLLLANYEWSLKAEKEETSFLEEATLIGVLPKLEPVLKEVAQVSEAVYFARDLINNNADSVTPQYLAETALKLSKQFPSLKTTVFGKKEIERLKMGLLYAVGRGSSHDPAFIIVEYKGNPRSKDKTVLVGKGITFDTGGLNLKSSNMETMRDDMSGGALVLGAVAAAASLKLKVNVTAVVPSAENAIGPLSYKPGDVYKSYLGKTVEIGDTDAEGRLILADALSYSVKNLQPTRLLDFATLTGSIVVALGESVAGLFSNDDQLAEDLLEASSKTGENLWRMPLYAPYKEGLKSDTADIKNVGGRAGGSIKAALFLEEFVSSVPWAHLDIAGCAFSSKEQPYLPKNGVGYGIRLIVEFLKKVS